MARTGLIAMTAVPVGNGGKVDIEQAGLSQPDL
jgi:hypothetical protein